MPADVDHTVVEQRILEASVLLPAGGAVTGWAALRMRGGSFFDGLATDGRTQRPISLIVGPGQARRERAGVTWLQDGIRPEEWSRIFQVPAACPERAVFDEARRAEELAAAVTALDMAFAAELTSMVRVHDYVELQSGRLGVPLVRSALLLADERSRSPFESRVRVAWLVDCGLPRPLVNQEIFDKRTGRLLGVADLLDFQAGLVVECDGGEHARAGRRSRDAEKDEAFRSHGIETCRVTGFDEHHPGTIVARIRGARRRAQFQPGSQRTWTIEPPQDWEPPRSLEEILVARDLAREEHERWVREGDPDIRDLVGRDFWP